MGLFSSDTKITVQSSSVQLSEDFKDLLTESILNSVRTEHPIVEDMITNSLNGVGMKSRNLLRYARDRFVFGLPDGTVEYTQASDTAVKAAIMSEVGKQVFIRLSVHTSTQPTMWAEQFVLEKRGWSRKINTVTYFTHITEPVYFIGAEVLGDSSLKLNYRHTPIGKEPVQFSEDITTLSPMIQNADYYHVIYSFIIPDLSIEDKEYYWFYNSASDKYPTLTPLNGEVLQSNFYPIVPFRLNSSDLIYGDYGQSVKQMLNYISLNTKDLNTSINKNPDVGEVDDAYLVFAIHLQTETQHGMAYLHQFFGQAYDKSKVREDEYLSWKGSSQSVPQYNTFRYRDANLQWEISYLYVKKWIEKGTIGRKGFVSKEYIPHGRHEIGLSLTYTNSVMRWTMQITSEDIEIVEVAGLNFSSHIYGGEYVGATLESSLVEGDSTFLIPVNLEVVRNIGLFAGDNLITESLRMVFNSWQKSKIKWYQKGIFKVIFLIVAVVLTAYGFVGAMQGYLALGYTVSAAVLTVLANSLVIGLVIQVGVQLLGKVLPAELAMIFAIVALALGVTGKIDMNAALQASSTMSSVTEVAINYDMEELMSSMEDFQTSMEDQKEELEELENQINDISTSLVHNLVYEDTSVTVRPELPEMFYQRTLGVPDNLYSMYDYIENFRAEATAAPDFYELMSLPTNSRGMPV